MSRLPIVFLIAVIVVLASDSPSGAAGAAMKVPCWFDIPDGETAVCYRVNVPVHHDAPEGDLMSLPVAVLKAKTATPATDPVVMIQGGPGASFFHTDYPDDGGSIDLWGMTETARQHRDIIVYDQRGVGLARPGLNCFEVDMLASSADAPPKVEATLYEQEVEAIAQCYERFTAAGIDLSAFSTPANANDLALVVRDFGYERVNLWAFSYGTQIALETLRVHGNLIRSAVLDGVTPPHMRFAESGPFATHRVFSRIFEDCGRDPWCVRAYGDIGDRFEELLISLNKTPRTIVVDNGRWPDAHEAEVDGDLLVYYVSDVLYFGDSVPYVPPLLAHAIDNDLAGLDWFYWSPFFADVGLDEGTFLSIVCREDMPRIRPDVMAEDIERYGVYGSAGGIDLSDNYCDVWAVPPSNPEEWEPVVSDVPVLLISGAYDPVTPPEFADETAQYLTDSRHFEFLGAGHTPSGSDHCTAAYVATFFDNPDPANLPPPDCPLYTNPADFSSVDW